MPYSTGTWAILYARPPPRLPLAYALPFSTGSAGAVPMLGTVDHGSGHAFKGPGSDLGRHWPLLNASVAEWFTRGAWNPVG